MLIPAGRAFGREHFEIWRKYLRINQLLLSSDRDTVNCQDYGQLGTCKSLEKGEWIQVDTPAGPCYSAPRAQKSKRWPLRAAEGQPKRGWALGRIGTAGLDKGGLSCEWTVEGFGGAAEGKAAERRGQEVKKRKRMGRKEGKGQARTKQGQQGLQARQRGIGGRAFLSYIRDWSIAHRTTATAKPKTEIDRYNLANSINRHDSQFNFCDSLVPEIWPDPATEIMTRAKVDPALRKRTANACQNCKRRKQKCNGLQPCNSCLKRNLICSYGTTSEGSLASQEPSPKRQMLAHPSASLYHSTHSSPSSPLSHKSPSDARQESRVQHYADLDETQKPQTPITSEISNPVEEANAEEKSRDEPPGATSNALSCNTPAASEKDEEAVLYGAPRMLQDPTGRLLYLGDSASLSYLQLIRMIIENVAGPSPFTSDPKRHRIVEPIITLPPNLCHTHLLPDKQTANVLVQSYFINTNGLLEVFDRNEFIRTLETCYTDPLAVDPSWLCLLHLVFAIGLVMAAPLPGTPDDSIIQKLKAGGIDRSYVFFLNAKSLSDPLTTGFEDAGFWSIQALALMTVYMLAISKRNTAYAYYGMAVRSAFSLGLHKEETMLIFNPLDQAIRRNLWRTLFILDRFLSASLGRPTAIHEDDCSGETLTSNVKHIDPEDTLRAVANIRETNSQGLQASVRTSHIVGMILQKVYSKRKISTKLAQEIADKCKGWGQALDPALRSRQSRLVNASQGIAVLHANLFYYHSVILLTRPFFVFLLSKEKKESSPRQRRSSRMESFAEACVRTSSRSIALVQHAYEGQYLPRRNPFILYFLFAAALITLSNQFSPVARDPTANISINAAINIMKYFSVEDEQARRLLDILVCFYDVVRQRRSPPSKNKDPVGKKIHNLSNSISTPREGIFPESTSSPPRKVSSVSNRRVSKTEGSDPNVSPTTTFRSINPLTSVDTPTINQESPQRSPTQTRSRRNSNDAFLDLSNLTSNHPSTTSANSVDGESLPGDAEIDFQTLWNWLPGNNSSNININSDSNSKATTIPVGGGDELSASRPSMVASADTGRDTNRSMYAQGLGESSSIPLFNISSDFKSS
ncbi:hypothetical protein B7463_g4540, partial [Scytalidium lignicola]